MKFTAENAPGNPAVFTAERGPLTKYLILVFIFLGLLYLCAGCTTTQPTVVEETTVVETEMLVE